jgi:hypothetical protein
MIHRREEATLIEHGGGMPGYEAHLLLDMQHGVGVSLLSSKPSIGVGNLARAILDVWRSTTLGNPPNSVDFSLPDKTHVQKAADYAGTFHDGKRTLVFAAVHNQATCANYSGSDFYRFFTP